MGSGPAGAAGGAASGAARTNPNITLNAQAAAAGRGGARLGGGLGALRKPGIGLQAFPSAAGSRDSVPWPPFWKAGEGGRIGGGEVLAREPRLLGESLGAASWAHSYLRSRKE